MAENMSIYAFKLNSGAGSQSLNDVLIHIQQTPLADRIRDIGSKIRIEDIDFDSENNLWIMDFGKFRSNHGSGKASATTAAQGFTFNLGEKFLEETACIYDVANGYLIVQYNHHGVRHGHIAQYLSTFNPTITNNFELLPVIDQAAQAKLRNRTALKKISFKIATRLMTDADRQQGTSLAGAISMAEASGSEVISMTMAATSKKTSKLNIFADTMFDQVLNIFRQNPSVINSFEASVVDPNGSTDLIDIVAHRLKQSASITAGSDLRFPKLDRYNALRRAYWSGYTISHLDDVIE